MGPIVQQARCPREHRRKMRKMDRRSGAFTSYLRPSVPPGGFILSIRVFVCLFTSPALRGHQGQGTHSGGVKEGWIASAYEGQHCPALNVNCQ